MAAIVFEDVIITSLVRYADADCIVRLLGRDRGRFAAFAKNGLKPSRARGSLVQAPARGVAGFSHKPHADLAKLHQLDLAAHSYSLSTHLKSFGWACYVSELTELLLPEQEPAPQVFDWLDEVFVLLAKHQTNPCLLRSFELKLLAYSGYLPDLTRCVDDPNKPPVAYDPIAGHLCSEVAGRQSSVPFDESAQQTALVLLEAPLGHLPLVQEPVLRMVSRIFALRLGQVSHQPLRSVAFLKSIRV